VMRRYEASDSIQFTFVGRAEGDQKDRLLEQVEECLIGLNLEPQQGWSWVSDGQAFEGDLIEAITDSIADALRQTDFPDEALRRRLADQLARALAGRLPGFDRDRFVAQATNGAAE
jgi:hypothetical protein